MQPVARAYKLTFGAITLETINIVASSSETTYLASAIHGRLMGP
jgi:hypothetical protein